MRDRFLDWRLGLPGNPIMVNFGTLNAVSDVRTDAGEFYVQAKRAISLSARADSELASVANQFVRQILLPLPRLCGH